MFSLICDRISGWVNNGEAGDLRRHRAHYDVIVMSKQIFSQIPLNVSEKWDQTGILNSSIWPRYCLIGESFDGEDLNLARHQNVNQRLGHKGNIKHVH